MCAAANSLESLRLEFVAVMEEICDVGHEPPVAEGRAETTHHTTQRTVQAKYGVVYNI